MTTYTQNAFYKKDGSIDIEKAMQAGHEARSAAIEEFVELVSSSLKAARNLFALQRY